jgi:hypothetical protein
MCLLNPALKASYDEELRSELTGDALAPPPSAPAPSVPPSFVPSRPPPPQAPFPRFETPAFEVARDPAPASVGAARSRQAARSRRRRTSPLRTLTGIVLGGLAGLALGWLVLAYLRPRFDYWRWFHPARPVARTAPRDVEPDASPSRTSAASAASPAAPASTPPSSEPAPTEAAREQARAEATPPTKAGTAASEPVRQSRAEAELALDSLRALYVSGLSPAELRKVAARGGALLARRDPRDAHARPLALISLQAARAARDAELARRATLALIAAQEAEPPNSAARPSVAVPGRPKDDRPAVPDAAARAKAKQAAGETLGAAMRAAETPEQQSALAEQILRRADRLRPSSEQFVRLEVARSLAIRAGDVPLALRAGDAMTARYRLDVWETKLATLRAAGEAAHAAARREGLIAAALAVADEARGQERFDAARRAAEAARDNASRVANVELRRRTIRVCEELLQLARQYDQLGPALEMLRRAPADPESNLALGRFRCFALNAWEFGIPMLALGADEQLRAVARLELRAPRSSREQVEVAQAWWQLSQAKPVAADPKLARERARVWYRRALPGLRGLSRAVAEKRLADERE